MRSRRDRIRHTLLFEFFLVVISVSVLPHIFDVPTHSFGLLSIAMSLLAMFWNYVYNVAFDKLLIRMGKPLSPRPVSLRAIHSIVFEIGFTLLGVPMVMYGLNIDFMQALIIDVTFLIAVPIYAFFFNLIYDAIYPMPSAPAPR